MMRERDRYPRDVIILCGGKGARLRPATDNVPKALVKLHGRPIIDYIIEFYHRKGFGRFTLCIGYRGDRLREHFANLPSGLEISFSDAGEDAGMLKRVHAAGAGMQHRFLITYGDTFTDLDVDRMLAQHSRSGARATIVVASIRNPFGLVQFDSDGWVTSFREKPLLDYYIGSFVIEPSAFEFITDDMLQSRDGEGLVAFFQSLAGRKMLGAYMHEGPQISFNTEDERRAAEERIRRFYTLAEEHTADEPVEE